jgi:hypothetical protein
MIMFLLEIPLFVFFRDALKGGKSGDNAKIRSYHGGGAKGKKVGVRVLVVI